MTRPSGSTRPCPYHLCQARALIVGEGTVQERIRSHKYEGFVVCPGSGYRLRMATVEQQRLMAERAVAAKLPRGINS